MATAESRRSRSPPPTTSSPHFPPDLIPEVASRLTSLQDFFALRAACRAYRALLPLTPSNLASQAPLLLVPLDGTESHALFHPQLRRIHRVRIPRTPVAGNNSAFTIFHPLGRRLAIYEIRGLGRRDLTIVDLVTSERVRLSSSPYHLCRVLLSGDLVLTLQLWAMPLYSKTTLQYCRLGATDSDWRVAPIIPPSCLVDLIFANGTLYALVYPGYRLAVVQLSEDKNSAELEFLGGVLDASALDFREGRGFDFCLAECCGELMLVASSDEFDPPVYHVYRWKSGEAMWERIYSLGGCSLFLANGHFAGCLGPDHVGIRGNSIYITGNDTLDWCVYSLADRSFDRFVVEFPGGAVGPDIYSLVWVFPSRC